MLMSCFAVIFPSSAFREKDHERCGVVFVTSKDEHSDTQTHCNLAYQTQLRGLRTHTHTHRQQFVFVVNSSYWGLTQVHKMSREEVEILS